MFLRQGDLVEFDFSPSVGHEPAGRSGRRGTPRWRRRFDADDAFMRDVVPRWSGAFSRDGGGPGVGRAASGRAVCRTGKVHVHRRGVPWSGRFSALGASGRGLSAGWGFWIGSGALRCVLFVCGREVSAASTLLTCASGTAPLQVRKPGEYKSRLARPTPIQNPRLCSSIYRFCGCRRSGISVGWHSGVPGHPDTSVLRVLLTPSPRRSEAPPTHGIPAPSSPVRLVLTPPPPRRAPGRAGPAWSAHPAWRRGAGRGCARCSR